MKTVILATFIALLWPQAGMAQNVWKCQANGKTTFSDVPCPSSGKILDSDQLNANTIGSVRRQWAEEPEQDDHRTGGRQYSRAPQPSCPSEQEIRNMETSAGSVTISKEKRQFLQDEARRARQCAKGQGNYTQEDWKQIEDAHRSHSSIDRGSSALARSRAESIHSAADPYEADRITAQRRHQERLQEQRRQRAATAARHSGPVQCNARGCNGPDGYYQRHGTTNNFTSPNGRFCQHIGNRLQCR